MKITLLGPLLFSLILWPSGAAMAGDMFDDMEGLGEELNNMGLVPIVEDEILTANRLRTAPQEVPASVTVIEAEQIEAWGVRTIPDLMRFVPGMFVGHGDDENNASVAYHASNPNVMRRLQVLVDGRSVFQSGIAAVVWNDIPVALEDIQRIEVTRGPNSATYGANSFLGVINIISKHPEDTLGTRLGYRNGGQGIDDAFASHSWQSQKADYRLSAKLNATDGFDGRRQEGDQIRDSHRHGSIVLTREQELRPGWSLSTQAGLTRGHTDMRKDDFDQTSPDKETEQGYLMALLKHEQSDRHSFQIRTYWQYDDKDQSSEVCGQAFGFEEDLYTLYRMDPDLANAFVMEIGPQVATDPEAAGLAAQVATGSISPDQLGALLTSLDGENSYEVTEGEYDLLQSAIINTFDGDFDNMSQVVCGHSDRAIDEERFDIEFQDTFQWNDQLRMVSGFNFRRDQVDSQTLFGGKVNNDTYRLFGNLEWRPIRSMVFNLGGTYEVEDANDAVFSPRLALNYLLSPHQSVRFVRSEAVRSPDLLEKSPNYSLTITSLSDNYLGKESGTFFAHQWPGSRDPGHEKIVSHEIGYHGKFHYGGMNVSSVDLDLKVYRDEMRDLISDAINLGATRLESDTEMDVTGAEMQMAWHMNAKDWIWLTAAYVDTDVYVKEADDLSSQEVEQKELVEQRLSAQSSMVASWIHRERHWSSAFSYFWYDGYNLGKNPYRRYEAHLRTSYPLGRYRPSIGFFWHHLVDEGALIYVDQVYTDRNIYYFQAGLDF